MGRTVCRRCDNAGVIIVRKKRQKPDGTTETVEVTETCPVCKGQGWVDQGGG